MEEKIDVEIFFKAFISIFNFPFPFKIKTLVTNVPKLLHWF